MNSSMQEFIDKKIGLKIREVREQINYSKKEFCDLFPSYISEDRLSKIESGIEEASASEIYVICECFGLSIDSIISSVAIEYYIENK